MLIVMENTATKDQIDAVVRAIELKGFPGCAATDVGRAAGPR